MDYELVKSISRQLPEGIVVQFHDNGEPLLYPYLGEALALFSSQIRCFDTNGKLLLEKAGEIIGNLDTITISTFEDDWEAEQQFDIVKEFLELKPPSPSVVIRCLGETEYEKDYREMGLLVVKRTFHSPDGSFDYKKETTVPEIGVCLDFLNHLAIKQDGYVSHCVRFDLHRKGIIGDANTTPLEEIWNGKLRTLYKGFHTTGKRKLVPLCETCEYWGVPTG